MTGWRAYALGAYVGIVAWNFVLILAKPAPTTDRLVTTIGAAALAIPASFIIGLAVAGLD